MKNVIYSFIILIMLPLAMLSCDPAEQYKSELSTIDSCLAEIDTIDGLLDGIEFDSLELIMSHVLRNESAIRELYFPDSALDESIAMCIHDTKTIRKRLKGCGIVKGAYGDEFNALKHQFMDLKNDILEGLYNDDQIREYISIEKADLAKVKLKFMSFHIMQNEEKARYNKTMPVMDAFIDNLERESEELE